MKIICIVCKSTGEVSEQDAKGADLSTAVCQDCYYRFADDVHEITTALESLDASSDPCECNACTLLDAVMALPDRAELFVQDWADA